MLFTADLRAFSERLSVKAEVKAEVTEVKKEEDATVLTETQVKAEVLTPVSIKVKREYEEEQVTKLPLMVDEKVTLKRSVKRRRKT